MGVDFDVAEFCRKLRAQEGPYKCPMEKCGKVYQSIVGMNYHLHKYDHDNPLNEEGTPSSVAGLKTPHQKLTTPKPRSSIKSGRKKKSAHRAPLLKNAVDQQMIQPAHEGLTYAEAQRMVEFEVLGKTARVEITEPLKFISKEEFEASQSKLDDSIKQEELSSTPHRKLTPGGKKSKLSKTAAAAAAAAAASQQAENRITLPEASFKILSNYNVSDAPPRPTLAYIRFIEKSAEELDGEVEYDMDEEDSAWLSIINEKRAEQSLTPVPVDAFELLMDRLEKESYFMMQVSGKGPDGVPSIIDDDAVCCICMDGECQNSNVILFCDMCNLAVHQDCYGVPYIPEGQWLCRRCLQSPSRAVDCVLCPNNGGAFKQTDRGHWAHVVCALWIPEVRFANTVFLEPIDSIETIPSARWKLTCYICKQRGVGACIQCHKTNCYAAFHVTCAQQAGLYMKMDTVRDSEPGPIMVQKTAFCDNHTPPDAEPRPKINSRTGGGILAMSPPGEGSSPSGSMNSPGSPDALSDKMKHARRVLAKRRSWAPIISIPTIPPERIQEIATHVAVPKKNQFIQRLIAYWTLKRQFRNGVPLLRRLQSSHLQRRDERKGEAADSSDAAELYRQLKYWQCLRQDLERARLLCELVRKREKLKKEFIRVKEQETLMNLAPLQNFMRNLLDAIQARDTGNIFGEPVDQNEVPDYSDVVKEPMDLSTMRTKLDSYEYQTLDDFHRDFMLMVSNCLAYNSKETVFYRAGVKMRDQGGALIRQARRDMEAIGFDTETGLLLDEPAPGQGTASQKLFESNSVSQSGSHVKSRLSDISSSAPDELAADIDMELSRILNEGKNWSLEYKLDKLLELKDLVKDLKSPVARNKRLKSIRVEIANVRRKMSLLASGKVQGMRKKLLKSDTEERTDTNTELEETTEDEEESNVVVPEKTEPEVKRGRKRKVREESDEDSSFKESHKQGVNSHLSPGKGSRSSTGGIATTPLRQDPNVSNSGGSQTSASPSGVNRRTAVLFTRKAASVLKKPDTPENSSILNNDANRSTSGKRRGGRPRKNLDSALGINSEKNTPIQTMGNVDDLMPAPPVPFSDSFRLYRNSGDNVNETDDDTQSETSCSSCVSTGGSTGSSCSDADGEGDEDGYASSVDVTAVASSGDDEEVHTKPTKPDKGLLPPLQLVWAKCRGYPWYPALIIDPDMPAGYMHNGVPIPAPPDDVLALKNTCKEPVHLVLFFDAKRTWQWLPRNKLERLGEDKKLDQVKLTESRKPADRKAVRRAFKDAILHRIEVTGSELKGNAKAAIALLEEDAS
ncbi:bromodomain-containing protein homolog isoform X2 [Frankliniella occidentalis]|uniref:Bromodomain-containing protein homolog isoform X2 n=1 Tax=Frankliniella occidentalis TaxID=133901 RepID=A0A6J1T602_FRAOC|nr:bromodomain-containing protein homolog isoform X2 [Frankliniella occidentalis]